MLTKKLTKMIETNAQLLGKRWSETVLHHPKTPSYSKMDEKELEKRAENVYSSLGKWLDQSFSHQEAKKKYFNLGRRRCTEGFQVIELVIALTIEKSLLWNLVEEKSFMDSSLQLHAAIQLIMSVGEFFDRAMVYTIEGYEYEKTHPTLKNYGKIRPTRTWFINMDKNNNDNN